MATIPIEDLLQFVVDAGASDLHLSVGTPPCVRLHGNLERLQAEPLTAEDAEELVRTATPEPQFRKLQECGTTDFAIAFRDNARFRASAFKQRGCYGMAIRLIPNRIRPLEEIGFPDSVRSLLNVPRGLILVTGPTGSGKTTTLASMIDILNATRPCHIMTIEDPIEYLHKHKQAVVNQREVGQDVPDFAEALRRVLRQDPDVILVGEMRDLETMASAITAAETGHLVFSTLHTTGAGRTVDRIIDGFPAGQQGQIRSQLAGNLKAVISQLLLPLKNGGGRVAAYEVMINTPSIANLIREDKSYRISNDILTGSKFGMISLEAHLAELCRKGMISETEMLGKAQDADAALQFYKAMQ